MKKSREIKKVKNVQKAYIENSGVIAQEEITETLEKNYMPYAMSVIISRALPEIDGFKPSHRKLLYTMYKMGLLNGARTKSANVVGQTMRLNPHGDSAIYETMVRLARGNEALLHPYVDSKGNFGKHYSNSMAYAASRYTEVKLSEICNEIFSEIDKNTTEFTPNYDNSTIEPRLLPTNFPSVLVNSNDGIAVSMTSKICPFNLKEVCDTTIGIINNENFDVLKTLKGPDFPGGGELLFEEDEFRQIYETGRGSFKIRAKYNFDNKSNCIEVTEIPYTTTVEAIVKDIVKLIKDGKVKEVSYVRDEIDLNGLKIAIDLKRGTDPEKLMRKLYKSTSLQDTFSCNFNILVDGTPRVMGVREIIGEWLRFREGCVTRRLNFDKSKKSDILHKLQGLERILLDIDKAIRVIRETKSESQVLPNLCIAFGIDEVQAEFVAEIKLRNLNEEYILKRIADIANLKREIEEITEILSSREKIRNLITEELKAVSKKHSLPRKTEIIAQNLDDEGDVEDDSPDYNVSVFLTKHGYFKKITPQSLRMSGEQKLKDDDEIIQIVEITNKTELLFFTDKQQAYKCKAGVFEDVKASVLGDFVPAKLQFDEGENVIGVIATQDFSEHLLFVFANGKVAKVPLSAYETKTNRRKLANSYADASPLIAIFKIQSSDTGQDVLVRSDNGKGLIFNSSLVALKTTKNTIGVQVITLRGRNILEHAELVSPEMITEKDYKKYKVERIPVAGSHMRFEQLKL